MDLQQGKKKCQNPGAFLKSDHGSPRQQSCMGIRNAINHSSGSDQSKDQLSGLFFAVVLAGATGRLILLLLETFIIQIR
jgi:hypothetical protein